MMTVEERLEAAAQHLRQCRTRWMEAITRRAPAPQVAECRWNLDLAWHAWQYLLVLSQGCDSDT